MDKMPMISIIIPIYNVEKFLTKCIESVVGQTYTNIEIICVNDGSSDNSVEILNRFAKKDKRIVVLNKENGGLSAARNDGMEIANGDYIMFVDGDDWIDEHMCERMIETLMQKSADCVMCCYVKEFENKSVVENIFDQDMIFEGEYFKNNFYRVLFGLLGNELAHPEKCDSIVSACMQIYKKEIVENVRFIDTKIIGTEDLMFQIMVYANCKKLVYINEPFYHYIKMNQSSLTTVNKPNFFVQREYMYSLMEKIIIENKLSKDYEKALLNRIALGMIGIGFNEDASGKSILKKAKELKKILKEARYKAAFENLEFVFFPIHWKVFFFLCKKKMTILLVLLLRIMNYLRKN